MSIIQVFNTHLQVRACPCGQAMKEPNFDCVNPNQ